MIWKKKRNSLYLYKLEKGDTGYEEGEFNGVAWVAKTYAKNYKGRVKYMFSVKIAVIDGELRFKKLKDAKRFAEKTIEWYF